MRKAWIIFVGLLALTLASPEAPAHAAQTEEVQRRVLLQVLNAHEFKVDRQALDRIGPKMNRLLVLISGDPRQRAVVRVRATTALSVYPSERTRRYLNGVFFDPELKKSRFGRIQRREAMISLGAAFGGEVVGVLAGFRDDEDPQIREGCAHALGATTSPRALPVLDAWLHHEDELFVRQAVDNAIQSIRRDGAKR